MSTSTLPAVALAQSANLLTLAVRVTSHLVNVCRGRAALEALGGDLLEAILPARAQQQVRSHHSELPSRLRAEPTRGASH